MKHFLTLVWALAATSAWSQADNCETLRQQIETKIASSGVTKFSVTVVAADAAAEGKVVGSCALGSKKIVYARSTAEAASAVAPKPARKAVITECKDGSTPVGGSCKRSAP
jgi:hypothetical protein